jgi:hypothetical protein
MPADDTLRRDPAPGDDDPKHELSAHSARILKEIDDLRSMETEKRTQPISTPEFHRLAEDITAKSRDVFRIAAEQEGIGEEAPTGTVTIEDVDRERTG